MNNAIFKVKAAIECLKDLPMSEQQINDRIAQWVAKKGMASEWQDLPEAGQEQLAQAMQKFFESEFKQRREAA
ncbi:MAG: hypothetical protein ACRCZF_14820 [Gemmataceae bacterium]